MLEPEKLIVAVARLAGHVGQLADEAANFQEIVDLEKKAAVAAVDPTSLKRNVGESDKIFEDAAVHDAIDNVLRSARLVVRMAEETKESMEEEMSAARDAS